MRALLPIACAALVLAGCSQPPGSSAFPDETHEWSLDVPYEGGHGIRIVRLPLIAPPTGEGPWAISSKIQLDPPGIGAYYPESYFYSVFTEGKNGTRQIFIQGLGGGWATYNYGSLGVSAQGSSVVDTRGPSQGGIMAYGTGHELHSGEIVDLVFALAYDYGEQTAPPVARLQATVAGPGAVFGEASVEASDRAGVISLDRSRNPEAEICTRSFIATSCFLETSSSITTENQTLIAWWTGTGAAGSVDLTIGGSERVADCHGVGSDVRWTQAVLKSPGVWTVEARIAGVGPILSWPIFYLLWADVPAVLREGVDDPHC